MVFLKILLEITILVGIILVGTFLLSFLMDLIVSLFDTHKGVYFNRMDWRENVESNRRSKSTTTKTTTTKVKNKNEDEVVVLNSDAPKDYKYEENLSEVEPKNEDDNVSQIDFDKAVQEQRELQEKLAKQDNAPAQANSFSSVNAPAPAQASAQQPKKDVNSDGLTDDEFEDILDEVTEKALKEYNKSKKDSVQEARVVEEVKPVKEEVVAKSSESEDSEEISKLKEEIEKQKEELEALKKGLAESQVKEEKTVQSKEEHKPIKFMVKKPAKNVEEEKKQAEINEYKSQIKEKEREIENLKNKMLEDRDREIEDLKRQQAENNRKSKVVYHGAPNND